MIKINLDAYLNGVIKRDAAPYREKKRKVLGLYEDKDLDFGFAFNSIQLHATLPLNHLGYIVETLNLRQEQLPDQKAMEEFDVILTWFRNPSIPQALEYLIWVEKQVAKGKKLIVLGYTGLEVDDKSGDSYPQGLKARLLRLIGLEFRGFDRSISPKVAVDWIDSDMMEYERKLAKHPGSYAWIVPIKSREVKSWATIQHSDFPDSRSSIVTTSSDGAYAMEGYVIWEEPDRNDPRRKWLINPFLFFQQVLGSTDIPVPDPTTIDGKRVFFSHIDGDSFHSFSQVERGKYSSEVLLDFLSHSIPEIPLGVSFIVAEIEPLGVEGSKSYAPDSSGKKQSDGSPVYIRGGRGNEKLLKIAKTIAALPNVELASHTYHHPYVWRGEKRTSAYQETAFDMNFEIEGSISYINKHIAPKTKKVKLLFWTGDTTPPAEAFAILEKMGIDNLNGGDGVYDNQYNSVSNVSPFARKTGKYWQYFTCQSNENLYTNLWRQDFNGLENVIETYKRTESPRRLQCANLYYHFYSGDRIASLNALKKIYTWVKEQGYQPVYPTEYIGMVKGFLKARIFMLEPKKYVVTTRGKLNTLRLDEGEVDMKGSYGVTGVYEVNDSQYISLDPKVEYPIIKVD